MKRLIQRGLMFGDLVHVASPTLVDRYNRALQHLTGKQTQLSDFHIDIAGYSPEIGDELDDHLYLNHNGVNRQFILLTTEQKRSPLLNAKSSTNHEILERFITANESQLFALTARDAVAGELENSVFVLTSPADLFKIRKIRVECDTTDGVLRYADELAQMVDRFKSEDDAWFDDVLIAQMIETAKKSGDLTRNPIRLKETEFQQDNFWTSHFGGIYMFPQAAYPAVIAAGDKDALGPLPVKYVFGMNDRNPIAKFFELNGLTETIIEARGIDSAAILRQKMDFIVIDAAADAGLDLTGLNRSDMRRLARAHADRLPPEYHGLHDLLSWAEGGGTWPRISSEHPAYFYTLRAANTPNAELTNMLLAELTPLDFRQTFICHKELFYRRYMSWSETKKSFVADFLEREYQVDKAGAREALFGHEPDMENKVLPPRQPDLIERVGPWGAVRRR
ncbi:MAG: hypothetical protein JJ897_01485 [Marinibacterium sp.]|nr:hypothetical protein [Marinibacterium sp.]